MFKVKRSAHFFLSKKKHMRKWIGKNISIDSYRKNDIEKPFFPKQSIHPSMSRPSLPLWRRWAVRRWKWLRSPGFDGKRWWLWCGFTARKWWENEVWWLKNTWILGNMVKNNGKTSANMTFMISEDEILPRTMSGKKREIEAVDPVGLSLSILFAWKLFQELV